QKNISENEMRNALCPEMFYGPEHGRTVILHVSSGHQIHDMQRNADARGLFLQQRQRDSVHRRTARIPVHGRQQRDDFIAVRLHRPQKRMGGILTAAPIENSLYHTRQSIWQDTRPFRESGRQLQCRPRRYSHDKYILIFVSWKKDTSTSTPATEKGKPRR